jgi:phage gp36-like protein
MNLTPKWNIQGKKQANPSILQRIEIKESDQIVGQSRGHDPYGVPIDAPLAVELIRELWKRVHAERVNEIQSDMNNLVRKLLLPDEKSIADIAAEIQNLGVKAQTWLDSLLHCSFALTVDRGLLLKVLSQPGCEGVRFYLCLNKHSDNTNQLSIVSVGVDIDGTDLNFEYDPTRHDTTTVQFMENDSCTLEYAKILKKDPFDKGTTESDIEPYVLFKYANHEFRYPRQI